MSESENTWRASIAVRSFFSLVAILFVVSACLPSTDGVITFPLDGSGGYQDGLGYRVLSVALGALLLAWVHRARMELGEDELTVRYLLWSRRIPLAEITGVTVDADGLSIQTLGGATFGSPVFIGGKGLLLTWLHRRTRADDMAAAILAARP